MKAQAREEDGGLSVFKPNSQQQHNAPEQFSPDDSSCSGVDRSLSGEPLALFDTGDAGSHLSLADYIAKHLGQDAARKGDASQAAAAGRSALSPDVRSLSHSGEPEPLEPSAIGSHLRPVSPTYLFTRLYHQADPYACGSQLNQLDRDSSNALEHLLPSAATRYKIMKKRLDEEIQAIEARLSQYRAIPRARTTSTVFKLSRTQMEPSQWEALQQEVAVLEHRLQTLVQHRQEAELILHRMRQNLPVPQALQQWAAEHWGNGLGQALEGQSQQLQRTIGQVMTGALRWMTRTESRVAAQAAFQQAETIRQLLEQELAKPTPNPDTLGALTLAYEKALAEAQKSLKPSPKQ